MQIASSAAGTVDLTWRGRGKSAAETLGIDETTESAALARAISRSAGNKEWPPGCTHRSRGPARRAGPLPVPGS